MAEAGYGTQQSSLRRLGRREWWLWFSALTVTVLSALGLLLASLPSLFRHSDHFYEIRSDQAAQGIARLLLLFNFWLVYRLWLFRRLRRQGSEQSADSELDTDTDEALSPSALDPVTGLYTRGSVEPHVGKEISRARRQKTPLGLIAIHLDDLTQLNERYGPATGEFILKEFAWRLKKACRGSDFVARLGGDDFLLVLPECGSSEIKLILDRLGTVEIDCSGENITLTYSAGRMEYQPGESPGDLIKRAGLMLQLYKKAAKDVISTTAAPH
jgi:diguanylate cyclase (GGDEF)-like protein